MRKVSREAVAAPTCLTDNEGVGKAELTRFREYVEGRLPKEPEFSAYKSAEVKQSLVKLFHGKCAYCETFYEASAPMDVEHYRPKGAVSEDLDHGGYWWLAMSWDNLLPSCIDCNRNRGQLLVKPSASLKELHADSLLQMDRGDLAAAKTGKKDSFPIAKGGVRLRPEQSSALDYGNERALLLDPTRDTPTDHIRFHVGDGIHLSLVVVNNLDGAPSERGATSIQVYGLNRLGLVQERTRMLRRLEFLGDLVIDLAKTVSDLELVQNVSDLHQASLLTAITRLESLQERVIAELQRMSDPEAPFSELARTWLARFNDRLLL